MSVILKCRHLDTSLKKPFTVNESVYWFSAEPSVLLNARSVVRRLVNGELETVWKEAVVRQPSCICLEGLKQKTEDCFEKSNISTVFCYRQNVSQLNNDRPT